MPMEFTGKFTVTRVSDNHEVLSDTLELALEVAAHIVGNSNSVKPFPNEPTYFFGPNDGTTSVIVRRQRTWRPSHA
jgi:hypothetical protein